jgi:hypothetical protein
MDARELDQVIQGIAKKLPIAMLNHPELQEFIHSICLISSYLKSEQDKRIELNDRMDQHAEQMKQHQATMMQFDTLIWGDKNNIEERPGLAHEWAASRKQQKRNEKLIQGVLVAVIAAVIIGLAQLMGVKIQ